MRALWCLAVAFTLAFWGNLLLEQALHVPPAEATRSPGPADEHRPLEAGRLSRALGTPLRPRTAPAPSRPLTLKLLGTLDGHAASVVETSTSSGRTMFVGDRWNEVELVEVGHGRITLRRDGALEQLGIGALPADRQQQAIAFTPTGAALTLRRTDLDRQLPELLDRGMRGGRIVPAFEDGRMIGFRLIAVHPGSLYEELGLKAGDIFETVNGAALSNPEVAFGLLARLRDQPRIAMGIVRAGQRLTWELSLN